MSVVVEERLTELFSFLPEIGEWGKPKYYFGDDKEINSLIKVSGGNIYPLIYQTSNRFNENAKNPNVVEADLTFVLAVQNTVPMFNSNRWATSYRNVLRPLYENIKILFSKANIIVSDFEYQVDTTPNYSETESKEKNKFIDIVDALVVSVTLKITSGCINTVALNNEKIWH